MLLPSIQNTSGILVSIVLALAIFFDVRHDVRRLISGRNVVLASIFAWFLLEAIMLSPELQNYSQTTYDYAVFCVFLAITGFLLGYHRTAGCRLFEPMAMRFRQLDDVQLLWTVVLICGIVGFAPILYFSEGRIVELFDGILGMRKTWGGILARGRYGGVREAILQLENFLKGAAPFAFILILDRRTTAFQKLFCSTVMFWPLFRAYGSGTRSSLVTSLLPLLAVLYFRRSDRVQRGIVVAGLVTAPLVYWFMAAMVVSRGTGEFSWDAGLNANYVGNEMLQELAFITETFPSQANYQWGYSYYVQIVNPIPRFIWKGKPTLDTGILMATLKGEIDESTGETYLTRSPGLIGEMYLNFGLLGIPILSFFGGWIVHGWDRMALIHSQSMPTLVLYCMGLGALFIMGRSFNASMYYAIVFLIVGVSCVKVMTGR